MMDQITAFNQQNRPVPPSVPTTAGAPSSDTGDPYRLSKDVVPSDYDVYLKVSPGAPTFSGHERINAESQKPLHGFSLNGTHLKVASATVSEGGETIAATVQADPEKDRLNFTFGKPVPAGHWRIDVDFDGQIGHDMRGIYFAKDGDEAALVSQCEPISARAIFPCFDEPCFKAPLRMTVETDPGYQVVANGAEIGQTPSADGKTVIHRFSQTKPIPPYLSAVTVGHYDATAPVQVSKIPSRVWVGTGRAAQAAYAQEVSAFGIPWLEKYFDQPYPFEKLDQVAVPGFDAGAMENAGAIFYRRQLLQVDASSASTATRRRIAEVILHENSHQWFGNLVTPQWWDDLWLNEAFAAWLSRKAIGEWKPEWEVWNWHTAVYRSAAMQKDALAGTHPIYTPVKTAEEAEHNFDDITYEKGSSVLRMVEQYIGEDNFRAGLRLYMRAHMYGNARSQDLWDALSTVSGQQTAPGLSISDLMKSWVAQPGFPLVSAEVVVRDGKALMQVAQRRFFRDPAKHENADQTWKIPMIVRYEDDEGVKEHRVLFGDSKGDFELPLKGTLRWVYPNGGATGFYRTSLSDAGLDTLLQRGLSKLQASERVSLLEDEWELACSGETSIQRYLRAARAMAGDANGFVIGKLCEHLDFLSRHVAAGLDGAELARFASTLLHPQLERLGWSARPGEPPEDADLRSAVIQTLARVGHDSDVVARARQLSEQEAGNPGALEPTLADAVVNIDAMSGGTERLALFKNIYLQRREAGASPDVQLRREQCFASFEDPGAVREVLDMVGGKEGVIPQEQLNKNLVALLANPRAQEATWSFIKSCWLDLKPRLGILGTNRVLDGLSALPPKYADEVAGFLHQHVPDAPEMARNVLDRLRLRAEFVKRAAPELGSWLREHVSAG